MPAAISSWWLWLAAAQSRSKNSFAPLFVMAARNDNFEHAIQGQQTYCRARGTLLFS
jgi:hypothetical protein